MKKHVFALAIVMVGILCVFVLGYIGPRYSSGSARAEGDYNFYQAVLASEHFTTTATCDEWESPGFFNYKKGILAEMENVSFELGYFRKLASLGYQFKIGSQIQGTLFPWQIRSVTLICQPHEDLVID